MKTDAPLGPSSLAAPSAITRTGWYRWVICALLFFATTINYIDRQILAILKPTLEGQLHWTNTDYGNILLWFQAAYALGYAAGGRMMDRIGVRLGYGLAVFFWSLAAVGHSLAQQISTMWPVPGLASFLGTIGVPMAATVLSFAALRFALGLTEGGNFPAAIKTVSEWFPKKERALATGIFNAGSNVGALITPIIVPWITIKWGWPTAFWVTGSLGFLWLAAWWWIYRHPDEHPKVSPAELAYIQSDPPDPSVKIPWLELLRHRQTWAFLIGTLLTSPIWWFWLFWIPDFLNKKHNLNLLALGPPLVVIYLMTDVGSVGGGWLSSFLIKRGWSINAARKTALLVCALCVVPVFAAALVSNAWVAVLLVGLAASAHQGFSANLYTLVSDTVPRKAVSSVVGIGGMAGAIGGMFNAKLAGYILDRTGEYFVLFGIASSSYLLALLCIHVLLPRLQPMTLKNT